MERDSGPCRRCRNPGASLRCSRCKVAQYCNVECQRQDWQHGGHKATCRAGGGDGSAGGSIVAAAAAAAAPPPVPLCPSCSTSECNESWRGKYPGLCLYCGQMLCGSCASVVTIDGNCGPCPTCAKPSAVITSTIASGTSGAADLYANNGRKNLLPTEMYTLLHTLLASTNGNSSKARSSSSSASAGGAGGAGGATAATVDGGTVETSDEELAR